ncbi:UvrD-helicase domain-containing protein [Caballeronia sp. SBC2]|uniref:UvrD-helicase domain-containing protein n=1 Tax=Caballeronia sp. SBC2 TaxID=2705547 RepID=UPI0013E18030|nr:UvrD-helicase domain-containing protein [Caballeronia sp. SBC2]QIE30058.1 RecBCD enzyme subunit RecB [Caballeronia sp. SBC2]
MRSFETLDVEACPGSGKTTLLVAKLAILANRWKSRRQGTCILSHTNAARLEIGDRLSSVSAGHLLLRHPHFVGTIHSFANEYLAVPWLRSQGRPIKAIDTEIALNDRWHRLPWGTRRYLEKQHASPSSLTFTQPDYTGGDKNAYAVTTDTYQQMLKACRQSAEAGYYCFDEMFVWASELLDRFPDVIQTLRERFPIVFIDEVQDNSELQASFLYRIFVEGDRPVVRQRFGDSNQAIYHRSGASGAVTDSFPGSRKADLPNSFRFGQGVADIATPLGIRPQTLVGLGPTTSRINQPSCPNTLFLFDDASVLGVLPAYAEYLIDAFSPESLANGDFTAVAGVHKADRNDHLPRFMGHYAPDYAPEIAGREPKPVSMMQCLARARLELAGTRNIHPIANRCAEGILFFLRLAGKEVPFALGKSANRFMLELLSDEKARQQYLALLGRLIESRCQFSRDEWKFHIRPAVEAIGESVVGQPIKEQKALEFLGWAEGDLTEAAQCAPRSQANTFRYPIDEPKISIRLASIHSVKGETHTATLVLESYHKTHHLKKLLPWLLGKKPRRDSDNSGEDAALLDRLKLHYVAMTRPSHVLCLAMRKDAFKPAELDVLRARNLRVIDCTDSAPSNRTWR